MALYKCSSPSADTKWLVTFFTIDLLNNIGGAALATIFGPSQPYIAERVGVNIDTITWVWTFYGFAGLVGFTVSSFTFKRYITHPTWKLIVILVCEMIFGVFVFFLASNTTFWSLVLCAVAMHSVRSYGGAGGSGLPLYTMGPDRSRALIMAGHAIVGVGFALGPYIVARHFPLEDSSSKKHQEVCRLDNEEEEAENATVLASTSSNSTDSTVDAIDIEAPWQELGVVTMVLAGLYIVPMLVPWKMPVYKDFAKELEMREKNDKGPSPFPPTPYAPLTLTAIVLYYASICGSERIFQSMQFTYGLCGPLRLSPRDAVFTDKMYNIGFTVFRFLSIPVTFVLNPVHMLQLSTSLCLLSSVGIALFSSISRDAYYALTFVFGASISWQYGCMYSFLAKHMDLVGARNCLHSIGCNLALLFPPTAGYLFTNVSPVAIWWFNLVVTAGQTGLAVYLVLILRKVQVEEEEQGQEMQENKNA